MADNTLLATRSHLPTDGNASDLFPSTYFPDTDMDVGLDPDADQSPGHIHPLFDIRHQNQALFSQTPLLGWDPIAHSGGVIGRSPQEILGGITMLDPISATDPPYPDTHFILSLHSTTDGSAHHPAGWPVFPYPLSWEENAGAESSSFGTRVRGMESQSILAMSRPNRSPPVPSNVSPDADILTLRSGPSHTDHHDHGSLELQTYFQELMPSQGLGVTDDSEDASGLHAVGPSQPITHEIKAAVVYSFSLSLPSSWQKIPQEQYVPKTGSKPFVRGQAVTFSVNGALGFNLKRGLERVYEGLDRRDDPVLEDAGGPVSCRLLFPGYPTNTGHNQIAVKNWKRDPSPIKRSKLGHEIAKRVNQYLNTLATIPIDAATDPRWTVGQGYMKLERMYLIRASWVSQGSLQPEIWVDTHGVYI